MSAFGATRKRAPTFYARPEHFFNAFCEVALTVDQTDATLIDAVSDRRHGSIEAVVAAEIQARLASVPYVRGIRVAMKGMKEGAMTVRFYLNEKGNPAGKLADAELLFSGGPLDGLKLIGFAVWERKGGSRNVTFPARTYSVNGERRTFSLLRPIVEVVAQEKLRDVVLGAFKEYESQLAAQS